MYDNANHIITNNKDKLMLKNDEKGREHIEQDGKHYYKNMLGNWEAEKDFWGNDKVETDFFGNPKINTDFLGNQKIETDWIGNQFDDDCYELSFLRKFRDTYVKDNHPEAIEEYYSIAPAIVNDIQSRENRGELFMRIY